MSTTRGISHHTNKPSSVPNRSNRRNKCNISNKILCLGRSAIHPGHNSNPLRVSRVKALTLRSRSHILRPVLQRQYRRIVCHKVRPTGLRLPPKSRARTNHRNIVSACPLSRLGLHRILPDNYQGRRLCSPENHPNQWTNRPISR